MEALFRKILCPVDFDRISIPAVELALKLAEQNKAKICLMYVIAQPISGQPAADLDQIARDNLRSIAHKWLEGRVPYEILVRAGDPAVEVVKAERDLGVDLIVISTHARTGVDLMVLGSVTDRVVRTSIAPVVTVRPAPAG